MYSGAISRMGIHGWVLDFITRVKPILYITHARHLPRLLHFLYKAKLNPLEYHIVFSLKKLKSEADILVCFNGMPYLEHNRPPKDFDGMKMFRILDYVYFPRESYHILREAGVDFLFGYARHDEYCDLFREYYPYYLGRVIPVPFGYAERFIPRKPFEERKNKVIALGSVNSFIDPIHTIDDFKELNTFFLKRGERFMHKFRRMLVENENGLSNIMDNKLPHYPKVKDFGYDIVEIFNEYKMFVSCESLLYFPAAKTFEGPAAGSVMACSDHPCFTDYGFRDGVNCITHKQFDINDFREKVSYYLNNLAELKRIQEEGTRFVRERYSHPKVAEFVYDQICEKYNSL